MQNPKRLRLREQRDRHIQRKVSRVTMLGLVARPSQAEAGRVSAVPSFGHSSPLWQRGEHLFTESPREVGVQLMSPILQSLLLPIRPTGLRGHSAKDSVHRPPGLTSIQKGSFARSLTCSFHTPSSRAQRLREALCR